MNRETDGKRKMMGAGQPDTTSQSGRHMKEDTKRETPGEPDNTTPNGVARAGNK